MDQQANENNKLGVRKGAWTTQEDELLRLCMKTHGEGKWHQVPTKAGLNRCRKSCRLRWLNYLKPNIKRGDFMQDEIDLILKLHKLLGNRWSLIAGRLPGRTGNDIKNYWNTRLRVCSQMKKTKEESGSPRETRKSTTIIRPKPRTLSKTSCFPNNKATLFEPYRFAGQTLSPVPAENHQIDWWKNYLLDDMDSTSSDSCCLGLEDDLFTNSWVEEMAKSTSTSLTFTDQGEPNNRDFWFDVELWNRSIEEQRTL